MKKTWVKIKRGLLDPKHRDALGIRIWLYIYMLDKANWEDGIIYDWKDEDAADDLSMPKTTVRSQRQGLQESGYIRCDKKQYSQKITIFNWVDPRKYDGIVINQRETDENESDENLLLCEKRAQSDNQSDNQLNTEPVTPTLYPQITNNSTWIKITSFYNMNPDVFYTLLTSVQQMKLPELLEKDGDKCLRIAEYYANDGLSFNKIPGRIINKFDTWDGEEEQKQVETEKKPITSYWDNTVKGVREWYVGNEKVREEPLPNWRK